MHNSLNILLKHVILVASLLGHSAFGAEANQPPVPAAKSLPAVGVFGRDAWPIIDHLRSKGFPITYLYYGADYTPRFLRQFNVIVVAENAEIDPRVTQNGPLGVKSEYDERIRALLADFVENGGGLLAYGGIDSAKPRPTNALLARWGAELINETIDDSAHRFTQRGGMLWEYNYTQEIAAHPGTKEVKTIFYPLRSLYGQGNQPLKLAREWTVLIHGTEQASSHPMKQVQEQTFIDTDKPGTYPSKPPLAAARDAGKGRVAIFAWNPVQTFFNFGHFMVEDVHFTRGGDGKGSDGLRLLEQTLTWLGEPSLAMRPVKEFSDAAAGEEAVKQLAGLAWWLRADSGVQKDDKGCVQQWNDLGGKGLNATQAVADARPRFVADGLNQAPCVRFDGKDDWIGTAPAPLAPDFTMIAVARLVKPPHNVYQTIFSYADTKDQTSDADVGLWTYQQEELEYGVRMRWPGVDTWKERRLTASGWYVPRTHLDPLVLGWRRQGDALAAFIQGVPILDQKAPEAEKTENRGFRLGRQSNSGNQFLSGDIAEVLLFERALSEAERATVEAYLAAKYRLAMPTPFGGYQNKPFRTQPKFPEPRVWSKNTIGEAGTDRHWFKGLIGARSALTGGKGTVAEYAAAAKVAKLDFIAFLEDWTKLDQKTWDAFRAECRQASTPDLLVMPGYAYPRGTVKDIYFKVGDIPWQRRDMCTADGSSVRNVEFDMFGDGECMIGPFDARNLKSPFWRANAYNSFAVTTTRAGKTDWDLAPFLAVTEIRDNARPVAVDLLTDPAQVAAAAKRFLTCLRVKDQDEARKAFKQPDQFNHWSQVSSGPMITHIQSENAWRKAYGKAIPGTERIMTRIMGESDQPLTELAVYDGTRLFRRYALSGKTFDVTLNALHDRAHAWTYVLTDAAGGKAVRAISGSTDFFHHRFMCGDRQNTLASSFDIDKNGNEVNIAAACMQQKSIVRGFGFPANAQIIQRVPWGWDGCAGGIAEGVCNPRVTLPLPVPEIKGEEPCIFGRIELPLASRDVICQATRWDYACASMSEAYSTHAPLIPLDNYTASVRCFEFKKTPDTSAAMLIEGYYRMLTTGTFTPGTWWYTTRMSHSFYNFGGRPNELASYAFMNYAGNDCRVGAFPPKNQWINDMAPLAPGGYFAIFNRQESAAVFPLDRPMLAAMSLMQDGWGRLALGYDDYMGKPFKKGDVVPFRLVLWNGPLGQPPDNRQIEQFRTSFGLHGGKPAYTVTPRQGKVLSTVYLLDLEAQNGGFAGTFTKAPLQHRLPVRVHGVNPHWSCGIVDRTEKWWLPTGTMPDLPELAPAPAAGAGYATYAAVDLAKERDLYLGNVVVCDKPDLVLTLLPDGEGGFSIDAHNPTDKEIASTVATVPEFALCPPIKGLVTVPPGSSVTVGELNKENAK